MLHGLNILRQQYSQLAKPGGANQSAISAIQTLADRLSKADDNQLCIQDRRAAVLALKGLSRDHNTAVGEHALPALLTSLQRDANDEDIARALVECCIILCDVQSPDNPHTSASNQPHASSHNTRKHQHQAPPVALQHTDVFLHQPAPLHCLLPLLAPDRAFYTRFASLQLLGSLLRNRPHTVQDHVLVAPGGCGAILECLAEGAGSSAQIVRNEALLLLPHLVDGNADIQKLVAFEGAFEKLLDVCAAEGRIEGGVVVQDALEGLEALLRYNVSNQNYFRETLSIPMLPPLLFFPPAPPNGEAGSRHVEHEYARQIEAFCLQDWDEQKVVNARIVLGIAGLLVGGQGEGRRANQAALLQCGMTKCLLHLGLASTAPASLKAQALHVAASLMHASRANQHLLSTLLVQPIKPLPTPTPTPKPKPEPPFSHDTPQQHAPPQPPFTRLDAQPVVVCLVETALGTSDAKGGLGFRTAAAACFRAYVADNMDARLAIINGMLPHHDETTPTSRAGKVLLESLVQNPSTHAASHDADAYKHLVSTMLFSYLVRGSETAKTAARVIAITPDGSIVKNDDSDRNNNNDDNNDDDDDDDDDDDNAPSSLIQVIVGNLTLAERELADAVRKERSSAMGTTNSSTWYSAVDWTRIMVGYLVLLSVWLYDSPLSVRDFLSESATLQAIIQPVAQSSGVDPLLQGLAAFLLGVAYEFDTQPGMGAVTRQTMQSILLTRIGADQFGIRISRVVSDARFTNVTPDVFESLVWMEEQNEAYEQHVVSLHQPTPRRRTTATTTTTLVTNSTDTTRSTSFETPLGKQTAEEKKPGQEDAHSHAHSHAHPNLLFDYTFIDFFRTTYALITKSITIPPDSNTFHQSTLPVELLDAQHKIVELTQSVSHQSRLLEQSWQQHQQQLEVVNQTVKTQRHKLDELHKALEEAQRRETELLARYNALVVDSTKNDNGDGGGGGGLVRETKSIQTQTQTQTHSPPSNEKKQDQQQNQNVQTQPHVEEWQREREELAKENEDLLVLLEELSQKRQRDKQRLRSFGDVVSDDDDDDNNHHDDDDDDDDE